MFPTKEAVRLALPAVGCVKVTANGVACVCNALPPDLGIDN